MGKKLKVGVLGCGNISDIYMANLSSRFNEVSLVACADLVVDRARAKALKYGIDAESPESLMGRPDIDIIVNLTQPLVHGETSLAILRAGKHLYTEKPLAHNRKLGKSILEAANHAELAVAGAPDTILGAGIQTCQDLIQKGAIGVPLGGCAFMVCPGHESWHPDPAFYYATGGGPVFDMGPYYLSALLELMGPIAGVQSYQSKAWNERTVGSGPKAGQRIDVQVPTHTAGLLRFESGAIVSLTMSFDVQATRLPPIELWGTEGSLAVPDPNTFGGPVLLRRKNETEWKDIPLQKPWADNSRGLGVVNLARFIMNGEECRVSGERCYHVLDVMEGLTDAAQSGQEYHPGNTEFFR